MSARLSDCATSDPNYPLWLLHQALDPLLAFLTGAGLVVSDGLSARLAHLVFLAALGGKMLAERVSVQQARGIVLTVAIAELLTRVAELPRAAAPLWEPSSDELDLLEIFCHTGRWPKPAVTVRKRLRRQAVARLATPDALLVGLLRAVGECEEDAVPLLDLEARQARHVLAAARRRLDLALLRCAEEALYRGGRDVPERYGTMSKDE